MIVQKLKRRLAELKADVSGPKLTRLNVDQISEDDLTGAKFDRDTGTPLKGIVVIFSTPRSGSTLLCDLLKNQQIVTAHEYLQAAQYRPLLEARWGVKAQDDAAYLAALARYRCSDQGLLGINVHGSHLPAFRRLSAHFGDLPVTYIILRRRHAFAQAMSYFVAKQTGQWSSHFEEHRPAKYDRKLLEKCLADLALQNWAIEQFIKETGQTSQRLDYEDIVAGTAQPLTLDGRDISLALPVTSALKKQKNTAYDDFAQQTLDDFYRRNDPLPPQKP